MTDKVPRDRQQPGWWRPGGRGLCLWCGASFERCRVLPGTVLQACGQEKCQRHQQEYEESFKPRAPKRLDREQRRALYDLAEEADPEKGRRLERVVLKHGVQVVRAEAYL